MLRTVETAIATRLTALKQSLAELTVILETGEVPTGPSPALFHEHRPPAEAHAAQPRQHASDATSPTPGPRPPQWTKEARRKVARRMKRMWQKRREAKALATAAAATPVKSATKKTGKK